MSINSGFPSPQQCLLPTFLLGSRTRRERGRTVHVNYLQCAVQPSFRMLTHVCGSLRGRQLILVFKDVLLLQKKKCHNVEFGWAASDPVLVVGFKSPRWEISALAAQIESDRVSKIKFKKQGTGIPMQKNKYPQPGLQFWSNSKSCRNSFIHVGTWALGQPCSGLLIPWPRNALWTSEVVITEEDWAATVGEIVSQQTSSHIEPSWRWEEKSRFSFVSFLP